MQKINFKWFNGYLLIILILILLLCSANIYAATLTQLEGSFKTGPALILIAMLIVFIVVGLLNRVKDTANYYAANRKISKVGSNMTIASN